jgi:hypothetical protein
MATERVLYAASGIGAAIWFAFDPGFEPALGFITAVATFKGAAVLADRKQGQQADLSSEFAQFEKEARSSLAYLVDAHMADQDPPNSERKMNEMWARHGQGNSDVFIDYIIHALMPNESDRSKFQVFNVVNTGGSIAEQFVIKMDSQLEKAKDCGAPFVNAQTKLHQLHQWLTHPEFKLLRKQAHWHVYV